jgi:hypothetical protein
MGHNTAEPQSDANQLAATLKAGAMKKPNANSMSCRAMT